MLNLDALEDALDVMHKQSDFIGIQQREILRLKHEYSTWGRDIIGNFMVALDRPEDHDDLREILIAAYREMSDEVARLGEFHA